MAGTPKYTANAFCKKMERGEFGGFDHEFFYNHAILLGCNVRNTLYSTIKTGKRVGGLAPRKIFCKYTNHLQKIATYTFSAVGCFLSFSSFRQKST